MRFLIDEDLPRSASDLVRRYGHEPVDLRDTDLRGAKDSQIAAYARSEKLCLLTGDSDFSDVRNYPPGEYAGIVVLKLPRTANASLILNLLETFLRRGDLVNKIPGNLLVVEKGRVRIRSR